MNLFRDKRGYHHPVQVLLTIHTDTSLFDAKRFRAFEFRESKDRNESIQTRDFPREAKKKKRRKNEVSYIPRKIVSGCFSSISRRIGSDRIGGGMNEPKSGAAFNSGLDI